MRFSTQALIFVARPTARWLKSEECFWQAPRCLRAAISISTRYNDCSSLFKRALGLRDAAAIDIIDELVGLRPENANISHVKDLIFWLSEYLQHGKDLDEGLITKLKDCGLFPVFQVIAGRKQTRFVSFYDDWYISDRPSLLLAFHAKVPILDFEICEYQRIWPLLAKLGLNEWTLSSSVDETAIQEGDVAFHGNFTAFLMRCNEFKTYGSVAKNLWPIQVRHIQKILSQGY